MYVCPDSGQRPQFGFYFESLKWAGRWWWLFLVNNPKWQFHGVVWFLTLWRNFYVFVSEKVWCPSETSVELKWNLPVWPFDFDGRLIWMTGFYDPLLPARSPPTRIKACHRSVCVLSLPSTCHASIMVSLLPLCFSVHHSILFSF